MFGRMSLLLMQGLLRSSALQAGPATADMVLQIKVVASAAVVTATELTRRMVFFPLPVLCQ
jgi:hypothetical protein